RRRSRKRKRKSRSALGPAHAAPRPWPSPPSRRSDPYSIRRLRPATLYACEKREAEPVIDCAFTATVVGAAPELQTSAAGNPWTRVNLVVGHGDEKQFISCAAFGDLARQVCESIAKNDRVHVQGGNLRINTWTSKEGEARTGLSCVAWRLEKLAIGRNRPS